MVDRHDAPSPQSGFNSLALPGAVPELVYFLERRSTDNAQKRWKSGITSILDPCQIAELCIKQCYSDPMKQIKTLQPCYRMVAMMEGVHFTSIPFLMLLEQGP